MSKFYLSLGLFFGLVATVDGQSFYSQRRERSLIATVGTGTSTYFGELSNNGDYIHAKPNFNVGLQYYLTNRVSARAEASWFQLSGSDAKADPTGGHYRRLSNLSLRTDAVEISLTAAVNLYHLRNRYYSMATFSILT